MQLSKNILIACAVITAFLAVLYFLFLAKVVLIYLLVAVLLAVAIHPLVSFFEKRKLGRVWASVIAMLLVLLVLGVIVGTIVTPLAMEGTALVRNLPAITADVLSNPMVHGLVVRFGLETQIQELSANASALLIGNSTKLLVITLGLISFASSVVIVIVITFLLMLEGEGLWHSALKPLSPASRTKAELAGKKIARAVNGYITGNLLISAIAAVITAITLLVLKVPYVFALSALVALFDLIPMVGAALATVVVGFVALVNGPITAIIVVAVLIVYQFVEGHFIQPIVYSKSVNLSPLFIVLVSIVGAEVAGIGGVLLAIPLAAIVEILAQELYAVVSKKR